MTDDELTIDELAQRVGMTVRNVRAHQARGLVRAPELRGRTGYYGPQHVARLELVKDLQAEGFNLESIRRILERSPDGTITEFLSFTRALTEPFSDEQPEIVEGQALAERWRGQLTPELVARIERLGFARDLGDGRWEILSPRLQRVSEEIANLGISLEAAVDVIAVVKRHAEAVARAYRRLFLEYVWHPFQEAGEPEERWAEIRETLDRIRPLASESLIAVFQLEMTREVERTLERELSRIGGRERPRPRRRRRRSAAA
jgi:DNA-binding transcriptional MerR regulator